jgi:hypothetical protein
MGDFARDARADENAKQVHNSRVAWLRYLNSVRADPAAVMSFEKAWDTYRQSEREGDQK